MRSLGRAEPWTCGALDVREPWTCGALDVRSLGRAGPWTCGPLDVRALGRAVPMLRGPLTDETDVMTQYMRSSFRIVNGVHEVLAPDFRGGPFGAPEVRAEDERELETVCEGYEILSPTQEWGERSGEDAADVDRLSPTQAVQPRRKRCRSRDDKPWRTTLEDRLSFPMTCKTMFADSGVAIRARGLREVVEIPKNRIYELLDLEAPEIRMAGRCLTSSRYATQLWFVANKLAHVANGN